ncbi:hypothetical protein XENOCAPTIV_021815 [Xenoophorus captivus]|uniref:Uncharacterized protein n=1 Tax=Xenoophorus captivus TaxID=1517983 RepID=A0ABV0QJN1_9TELE
MAPCKVWISLGVIPALTLGFFLCHSKKEATSHQKRWTPVRSHLRPLGSAESHPFLQNYWYRYVYDTAKSLNKTDCYVCSVMPVHSQGPTIYVKAMNDSPANCATSFGKLGYAFRQYFIIPRQFPQENQTLNYTCNPHNCDSEFWNALNITEEHKVPPFNAHLNGIKQHAQSYNKSKGNNYLSRHKYKL